MLCSVSVILFTSFPTLSLFYIPVLIFCDNVMCHMWEWCWFLFIWFSWHRRNGIPHKRAWVIVQNGGGGSLGMSSTVVKITWSVRGGHRGCDDKGKKYWWERGKGTKLKKMKKRNNKKRPYKCVKIEIGRSERLGRDCNMKQREKDRRDS